MPVRDLKRLAAAVNAVREQLGLSQDEFAKRGELALKTVQRVEWGSVAPRAKTLHGLDQAAGWAPGTARGIYEGTQQTPTADTPPDGTVSAARQRIIDMSHEEIAMRIAEEAELKGPAAAGELLSRILDIRESARQRT